MDVVMLDTPDAAAAAAAEFIVHHGEEARSIIWLVTGRDRAEALRQLVAQADVPATRLDRDDAVIFTDPAAASLVVRGPGVSRKV